MTANPLTDVQAIAEAWASIDGKLALFHKDKNADDYGEGYYEGYLTDAAELKKRLLARGYKIVPATE